jgi:hypothetical protein
MERADSDVEAITISESTPIQHVSSSLCSYSTRRLGVSPCEETDPAPPKAHRTTIFLFQ